MIVIPRSLSPDFIQRKKVTCYCCNKAGSHYFFFFFFFFKVNHWITSNKIVWLKEVIIFEDRDLLYRLCSNSIQSLFSEISQSISCRSLYQCVPKSISNFQKYIDKCFYFLLFIYLFFFSFTFNRVFIIYHYI